MQVCLVSNDEKLRDFLSTIVGSGFLSLAPGEKLIRADFYIFDFQLTSGVSQIVEAEAGNCLFLVDPKDLAAFGEQMEGRPVSILLKPIQRRPVEAFLESFRQSWQSRSEHENAERFRSERDELLQHLLQANLRLQEYDQERTQFLARALHDLRTPLMSIRGICGLLLQGDLGPLHARQRELLESVEHSSARMARLVSGMFELSIEGRVQRTLQFEPGNIETCVRHALQDVSLLVQEKQLRITSDCTPPPTAMFMESQRIEELLINLLENACKFTPRCGKIDVHGYPVSWDFDHSTPRNSASFPNAYRIDVRDSGPGIDSNMLEAIFEQYTSAVSQADRSGGGLGLAICRLVAEAHKGRVWAMSSKDGAVFSLVLPFDPRVAEKLVPRMSAETWHRSARAV